MKGERASLPLGLWTDVGLLEIRIANWCGTEKPSKSVWKIMKSTGKRRYRNQNVKTEKGWAYEFTIGIERLDGEKDIKDRQGCRPRLRGSLRPCFVDLFERGLAWLVDLRRARARCYAACEEKNMSRIAVWVFKEKRADFGLKWA